MTEIDFWFDVVCPFAYLGSTRIEEIAASAGVAVRWRPILLGGLLKAVGGPVDPNAVMVEAKRRWVRRDMERQAAWLGVPLRIPDAHPRRTLDAMRLLAGVPDALVPSLARRLFSAYWVHGADIADRAVLRPIAGVRGLDLDAIVDAPATKERLHELTREAAEGGVFGVPTVGIGERRVWGVDRLRFVRSALGVAEDDSEPAFTPGPPAPIEWFHDFSSPFSYLASTRVAKEVLACPILVGALFRDLGSPQVPLHTYPTVKQAWTRADLQAWAEVYEVPLRFPTQFPIRSVQALRVAIVEPRATSAMYRAAWADDLDVGDPAVLTGVLDAAGFDGSALLAASVSEPVKAELRANTDRAQALGVFGVPSFQVGGELFFGQDRLHHVALAARGWRVDP